VNAVAGQGSNPENPVSKNVKTGLILACVAFVFFAAIIAKYWLLR
jgi:hypothetical protein